ncbi:MAG: dynamin family protein [Phycisphaerae bacterium]|nr:dynamin family protein [Phycisphaerae bacterium]MCZ2400145.1 dynamin family protein [Phycisphaerae bacterium]NUQ47301.1 dynamin family protein [Phycisphaerae bacterium]
MNHVNLRNTSTPATSHGATTVLDAVAQVAERFALRSLQPSLAACRELAEHDAPLDVAVLGQFKSGKSSLLNALVGSELLPVGVLPVTTVVTRLSAGKQCAARVTYLDGRVEPIAVEAIADFVAETRNPANRRQVACVDLQTPAWSEFDGLRLVDTPGLGSILSHNTQSTQEWLPHVAVALVVISADRPLADEDRRLLTEVRRHAPRVAIILSKVDLLSESQRVEVEAFVREGLRREQVGDGTPILPFSTRTQTQHWKHRLSSELLLPLARQLDAERERTLRHKLAGLTQACREYLTVALRAAERTQEQRDVLKNAVLGESVREGVIRDELSLTSQRLVGATRTAFEAKLKPRQSELADLLVRRAREELPGWCGNLAVQRQRFEEWLHGELLRELSDVSQSIAPLARQLVEEAQERFARLVEAFRDRLSRNMDAALGISLSPLRWEARPVAVAAPPIAIGKVFDISIDLLWFLIPMRVLGGLFHGHFRRKIPWEVEKNLSRLAADWSDAVCGAIVGLHQQALDSIENEIVSLTRMLRVEPADTGGLQAYLARLEKAQMAERTGEVGRGARGMT